MLKTIICAAGTLPELPANAEETGEYLKKLWEMLEEYAVTYGGRLLIALLVLIVGFKLVNFFKKRLEKSKAVTKLDVSARGFLLSMLSIVFKVLICITALSVMGVPMTSIITVIGSCGLAVGLALQGSLANIAGGFVLMVLKPFSVGDFIVMGDMSGTVEELGLFNTKLLTIDNRQVILPNAAVSNATLVNVTAKGNRRVDLTFSAAYSDDVEKVEEVLLEVCEKHPLVLADPAPFARLSAHKDSALEYTVRAWCAGEDYWTVYFDLIKEVKLAFDRNGVTIPFPQMDLHTKAD
ncbi:MAG: mechanosensitive ion channel family protein [Clostridia bacterium]|nr:mechanosensitive ion channel family protein [Clostridia bacterium]